MVRALRIASEVAVYAFITVSAFWPRLPRAIGLWFGVVGMVAMCTQIAFRLHDTNRARKHISIRD
jgi:hypothetical protein